MAIPTARPASGCASDALLELAHRLRRALLARGEFLPSPWVEEAARDLKSGRLRGWVTGTDAAPTGLAFFSPRPQRAFAHLHLEPGTPAVERGGALVRAMLAGLPPSIRKMDVGATGLTADDEASLGRDLAATEGMTVLRRFALERPLRGDDRAATFPAELALRPIRDIPVDALANLDWHAFQGTADEGLVADSVDDSRRIVGEILAGELGRFLEEASTGVTDLESHFVGFVLAAEQTPQRAVLLDLVVHPSFRRRGIGEGLLAWSARALRALGYDTVRLWVTETNTAARRLYDRTGFRPVLTASIYRFDRGAGPAPQAHPGA